MNMWEVIGFAKDGDGRADMAREKAAQMVGEAA
jgi:hypothetical protein